MNEKPVGLASWETPSSQGLLDAIIELQEQLSGLTERVRTLEEHDRVYHHSETSDDE